jgi:hypothetical protein
MLDEQPKSTNKKDMVSSRGGSIPIQHKDTIMDCSHQQPFPSSRSTSASALSLPTVINVGQDARSCPLAAVRTHHITSAENVRL